MQLCLLSRAMPIAFIIASHFVVSSPVPDGSSIDTSTYPTVDNLECKHGGVCGVLYLPDLSAHLQQATGLRPPTLTVNYRGFECHGPSP